MFQSGHGFFWGLWIWRCPIQGKAMHGRVACWSITILALSSKQIFIVNEESIVALAASCIYLFLRWNGQFFTRSMEVRIQQQSDAIFQFINQCLNNYMKQAIEQRLSSAASLGLAQVVDALPIKHSIRRRCGLSLLSDVAVSNSY